MGPDNLANLLLTMPFSSKLEQQLQVYVEKKITFLFKFHPTSSFISRNMKLPPVDGGCSNAVDPFQFFWLINK